MGKNMVAQLVEQKFRGLDKGTLVLVNGAPMNLLNYNAISNIPLDSIEKIEIVRGSNATLYGAEAMGGVINIITKKASGSAKTTISGTIGNYTDKWSVGHQNELFFQFIYDKDYYDEVNPQTRKFSLWRICKLIRKAKKIIIIL